MYFCTVNLNSRVVSCDLHTKYRPLAAGFKAYYPTEHAAIAQSDCTILDYMYIVIIIISAGVFYFISSSDNMNMSVYFLCDVYGNAGLTTSLHSKHHH